MTQGNMWNKYPGESRSHKLINKENWPCLLVLVYLRDVTRNKHTSDHSLHCHVWQQAATSWRHNGHWLVTLGQKMIYAYLALLGLTFLITWTYWYFLALLGWLTQSSFPSVVIQATGYSSEDFGEFCIGEVSSGLCIMDEWWWWRFSDLQHSSPDSHLTDNLDAALGKSRVNLNLI